MNFGPMAGERGGGGGGEEPLLGVPYLPAQVSEADVELVLLAGLLLVRAAVL